VCPSFAKALSSHQGHQSDTVWGASEQVEEFVEGLVEAAFGVEDDEAVGAGAAPHPGPGMVCHVVPPVRAQCKDMLECVPIVACFRVK
jgi:hypothetical protein